MSIISPSLLSADFTRLGQQIEIVEQAGATHLHLDVMDGEFVPNITFGPFIVNAIRRLSNTTLDAHLMIQKPHRYLEHFVKAGADSVTIHFEASEDIPRDLETIRQLGAKAGIAINPDKDFDVLEPYLHLLDEILIMSVFPGFGGQSFIESTLETMRRAVAARNSYDYTVAVDGGVNMSTIDRVNATGIDLAVVGSGLYKVDDIPARFAELSK